MLEKKSYLTILWGALALLGLYLTSLHSYLLFHSLAEIFSIVIACGIFIVAWNARRLLEEEYLLLLGLAYLFIGGLDLVHTLGYVGMGVFPGYETNLPTQLWIAARYVESFSLFAAPFFLGRRIRVGFVFVVYGVITALLLGAIFYWGVFPTCFIEGRGLTPFKKISEYAICLVLLGSIATLVRRREHLDPQVLRLLIGSIALTIASELAFTLYVHAYGLANLFGHFFKIISFYLIYKAVIEAALQRPYAVLFRDLKQRQEDLQESEENLRAILNSSTASVLLIDTAGTILALNKTSARTLGKSADELVGSCLYDAVPPDVSKGQRGRIEEVIREGTPARFEDQRDGRWFGRSVYPVFDEDGKVRRLAIYAQDITEHKKAEEELREFSRAMEQSPASVVITDAEGTIEYVNPKFVELTGYTAAEAIGQNPRILKSGEQPPEFYRELWETISHGEQWKGEFLNKKKNGNLYWEDASISPIRNDEGVITHFVGVKIDITRRKKAEEALQKAHDELERRVEERTAELSKAITQLRGQIKQRQRAEKELQKSQEEFRTLAGRLLTAQEAERSLLAREMHDDLTQRLAVLSIEAGKLEQQLQSSRSPASGKLGEMRQQMVKLSTDVHAISRQLHPSILDDLGLVDAIKSECNNFTQREGIVVNYKPVRLPPRIPRDIALCIYRIIQEGLRNIAKHAQATEAHVSLIGKNDALHLSIKDTGIGFDPLQAKKKTSLGLASMEERVRLIQGKISIESQPGQGTVIQVKAPLGDK